MKKTKQIIWALIFLPIIFMPLQTDSQKSYENVFASTAVSLEDILERRYNYLDRSGGRDKDRLVKVLIVPGHDDENYGTEHLGVREVDLNRRVGIELHKLLLKEPGINSVIVSDNYGYNGIFEKYFDREEDRIKKFIRDSQRDFEKKIRSGDTSSIDGSFFNVAPPEVVNVLYGINRWANVKNFDLVIHIHFNDYRGRWSDPVPKYDGFAIYIPDEGFMNHELSKELATNISNRLKTVQAVSNLPQESAGIITNDALIATGANETLEPGSILIEYGYVYEQKFLDPSVDREVLEGLARQTYLGIKDMLDEDVEDESRRIFSQNLAYSPYFRSVQTLELQRELVDRGYYPTEGKTVRECPINGEFGICLQAALKNFQRDNGLPATGFLGERTRDVLNGS